MSFQTPSLRRVEMLPAPQILRRPNADCRFCTQALDIISCCRWSNDRSLNRYKRGMWLPDIIHQIDVLPIYAIYKNMHMAAKLDVEIADPKKVQQK